MRNGAAEVYETAAPPVCERVNLKLNLGHQYQAGVVVVKITVRHDDGEPSSETRTLVTEAPKMENPQKENNRQCPNVKTLLIRRSGQKDKANQEKNGT